MARFFLRRRARGLNFLLGGCVVLVGFVVFILVVGRVDLRMGGAPAVRIETPPAVARAGN